MAKPDFAAAVGPSYPTVIPSKDQEMMFSYFHAAVHGTEGVLRRFLVWRMTMPANV